MHVHAGLRGSLSRYLWVVTAAVVALLATGSAGAVPGALDPSFGSGGLVTTAVANRDTVLQAVALQSDGKIVAAGWLRQNDAGWPEPMNFVVARYNSDGTLDPTFGSGGLAVVTVGSSSAANAVAIQPDGKIVVAGFTADTWSFALARLNSDGTLDSTFGAGGKVITAASGLNTQIYDLAIQPDGKIVAAGGNRDAGAARNFLVARYLANGTLDATFGSSGLAYTYFFGWGGIGQGVVVQPDGKIVEIGEAASATYPFNSLGVVRFDSDGTLDSTFGSGGKVATGFEGGAAGTDIALQPDGKLVGVGWARTNYGQAGFGLARFNTDGTLDSSFGTGGTVWTNFGQWARSVALRDDGKIVAAGYALPPNYVSTFALAQYNSDGSLDTSFGTGGTVTTPFTQGSAMVNGLAIQSDGKIVAGGNVSPSPGFAVFGLARYIAGDTTPPELSVTLNPNVLRPPNHRYVTVQATVMASDDTDPNPTVTLVSVISSELDNGVDDGNTTDDIVINPPSDHAYADTFQLRAERSGVGTGRTYTVTYSATDTSGNSTTRSATVTVPLN